MFHAGLSTSVLLGGAIAAAGVLIALLGLRHVWRASAVLRAPTAGGDAATNVPLVRLEGTVDATPDDEPVEGPFSGTPSVVLRAIVEERQVSPTLPLVPWDVTIREDVTSVPFEIRTPATTATVEGSVGTAILDREPVATVAAGESPPDRILAYDAEAEIDDARSPLASLPGPLAGLGRRLGLGRRTYGEERLEPGDDATVVGHAVGEGTVDPLVVADRSPRQTFLAMARTGLVAGAIGVATVAVGALILVA